MKRDIRLKRGTITSKRNLMRAPFRLRISKTNNNKIAVTARYVTVKKQNRAANQYPNIRCQER